MNKIAFEDLPSQKSPINSTNLNKLQTNIEDEFEKISPSTSVWTDFGNKVSYRKVGTNVEVNSRYNTELVMSNASWITLGNLPEGYRPVQNIFLPVLLRNIGTSNYVLGQVQILTNGEIHVNQRTGEEITTDVISFYTMFSTIATS